jgi:hypothetical protein
VNCALYEDSCTWVVPGSHLRRDTPEEIGRFPERPVAGPQLEGLSNAARERAALEYCQSLPGAQRLLLDAGDYCLYRNSLWHLGNYIPYRKRATLHDGIMTPAFREWFETAPKIASERRASGITWENPNAAVVGARETAGFIYFWWRNQSDFILLLLSIGLMMASLMVAIATLAALGSTLKDKSPAPIGGWILTVLVAFVLGIQGGVLALFLGGGATLFAKVLVLGISLFGWKIRETLRPPQPNFRAQHAADPASPASSDFDLSLPATQTQHTFLIPQRGTLLDRFVPVLVLGAILFVAARQIKSPDLWTPTPPASADNGGYLDNSDSESGDTP